MQQVINAKEQNKIVFPFFLLPLTAAILACVLYLCYEPGVQGGKKLIAPIDLIEVENDSQRNFILLIEEIQVLEDSMDELGTNRQSLNLVIESKLKELTSVKQRTDSRYEKLNSVALATLIQLHEVKKEIITLKGTVVNVKQLQEDLNNCNAYLIRSKTQFRAKLFPNPRPMINEFLYKKVIVAGKRNIVISSTPENMQ